MNILLLKPKYNMGIVMHVKREIGCGHTRSSRLGEQISEDRAASHLVSVKKGQSFLQGFINLY